MLNTACKFVPAVRWLEWILWEDGRYILELIRDHQLWVVENRGVRLRERVPFGGDEGTNSEGVHMSIC